MNIQKVGRTLHAHRSSRVAIMVVGSSLLALTLAGCSKSVNTSLQSLHDPSAEAGLAGAINGLFFYIMAAYVAIRVILRLIPGVPDIPPTDLYQSGRGEIYDFWFILCLIIASIVFINVMSRTFGFASRRYVVYRNSRTR